jgi:hypothetical protein
MSFDRRVRHLGIRQVRTEHQKHHRQVVGGDDRGLVNSIANSQFGWIRFFIAISPTLRGLLLLIPIPLAGWWYFFQQDNSVLTMVVWLLAALSVSSIIKGCFYKIIVHDVRRDFLGMQ